MNWMWHKVNYMQSKAGFYFNLTGCLTKTKEPSLLYYLLVAESIHAFLKSIYAKWNANNLIQYLNTGYQLQFFRR